jgi:putative MATE family efflux protein
MLSMTLASVVGIADIAMVGRLGSTAQAAVGYAAQLFFLAQSALFALSFACVALMARAIGAGRPAEARRALAASLIVALGASLLLLLGIAAHPAPLLARLSASPEVIALCVPYLRLLMASTVLLSVCLTLESAFRADRDTKTPMRITLGVTCTKLALNGLLIFGAPALGVPAFGVAGAGYATLLAQCLALALFVTVTRRKPAEAATTLRLRDFQGLSPYFRPLVRIALPGVAERIVMNLAMVTYFAFIGTYGTAAAAAYTIGIRILSFTWIPGTGYSQAVATLVAQALGAGDVARAERSGWRAARLASPLRWDGQWVPACASPRGLFTVDEARRPRPLHALPLARAAGDAAPLHAGGRLSRRGRHRDAALRLLRRQLAVPRAAGLPGRERLAPAPDLDLGDADPRSPRARSVAAHELPARRWQRGLPGAARPAATAGGTRSRCAATASGALW